MRTRQPLAPISIFAVILLAGFAIGWFITPLDPRLAYLVGILVILAGLITYDVATEDVDACRYECPFTREAHGVTIHGHEFE